MTSFNDFLSLLTGDLGLFRYPVADLVERYRDRYSAGARSRARFLSAKD